MKLIDEKIKFILSGGCKCDRCDEKVMLLKGLKSRIKGEFTQEEIRKEVGRFAKDSIKVRKLKGEKN